MFRGIRVNFATLLLEIVVVLTAVSAVTIAAEEQNVPVANTNPSHWSLRPLERAKLPEAAAKDWARNEIDLYIGARLKAAGLPPSPPASRRTLIRRLSFDLIGLPPTPEEIDAFINDDRPDAYERLVDRLLASPHYGERWARHWLDVVRFGESHGFEYNRPRTNAWHYRNWVIDALNQDMPYDQFVQMQIAGDVIDHQSPAHIAATGFLVAGPHNTTLPQSVPMRMTMQQQEYEDLVGTIGQTFLGLTVNCARCHDHKGDPITMREYYSFVANIAGVTPGDRKVNDTKRFGDDLKLVAELDAERRRNALAVRKLEDQARKRVLDARNEKGVKPQVPAPIAAWDFEKDLRDHLGDAHGEIVNGARIENGAVVVGENGGFVRTKPLALDLNEKTLEAWVTLDTLKQGGGGVITVQTVGGGIFDSIVFAEREPQKWMAGSNVFVRYDSFKAPVESEADTKPVHVAIVYHADGRIIGYRNGKPYGRAYKRKLQPFLAGKTQVLFGLRHDPAGGNRHLRARIERAQLYNRALDPHEIAASAGVPSNFVSETQLVTALTDLQREERDKLKRRNEAIAAQVDQLKAKIKPIVIYANQPRNPGEIRVLNRGNVNEPGEVVAPGGLSAVPGVNPDFGLKPNAPDHDRRTKLAEWITDKNNALFSRVIANRIWHHHFGVGIVDTPNDFGVSGGRPTHPQLLDWLATETIARGWRLKAMHRLIVTSATYRQSSQINTSAMKIDLNNRLLWRMSPRRLEAEALRDAMLAVSGKLNTTVGGVGYRDVRIYTHKGASFYDPIQPEGPEGNRRTVYRFTPRGAKKTILDTFDCADPSVMVPRRMVTTTPLQALSLLNNPLVLELADDFAERVENETNEVEAQIDRIHRLAYGRSAKMDEIAEAKTFITEHGLAAYCRVIFNSNEFLYVH